MKLLITMLALSTSAPLMAAVADDASSTPRPGQERQICRRVAAQSGSHVSRERVCRTAREWNALHDQDSDADDSAMLGALSHSQAGSQGGLPPAPGGPH